MIVVEFFEALDTLARAIAVWIVIAAAFGTVLVLGVAAGIAWVWRAVRKRLKRPSWARGRRKARIPRTRPNQVRRRAHRASGLRGGRVNPGYALGIGIICAPFISALLLAIHRGGRALYRHTRTHRKAH